MSQQIQTAMYEMLAGDGTLTTLLGHTATVNKIWSMRPAEEVPEDIPFPVLMIEILPSAGKVSQTHPPTYQHPDELYYVRAVDAREQEARLENICDRVVVVLKDAILDIPSGATWRGLKCQYEGEIKALAEDAGEYWMKMLRFRVRGVHPNT